MSVILLILSFASLIGFACRLNVLHWREQTWAFVAHVAGAVVSALMLQVALESPVILPHIFIQSCVAYCLAFTFETYVYA